MNSNQQSEKWKVVKTLQVLFTAIQMIIEETVGEF